MTKQDYYKFSDGKRVEVEHIPENIDANNITEMLIRVNIPNSELSFYEGHGDPVWCLASEKTMGKWRSDTSEGIFFVKTQTSSTYYPDLRPGTVIPIELRKDKRPVALYSELQSKYGHPKYKDTISNLENLKKRRDVNARGFIKEDIL